MSILEGPMSLRSYSENTRDSQSNWDLTKTMDQPTRPHFFWPHCHMCFIWEKKNRPTYRWMKCSSSKYIIFFSPSRCPSSVPRFPQPKNVVFPQHQPQHKNAPEFVWAFLVSRTPWCFDTSYFLLVRTWLQSTWEAEGWTHPPKFGVRLFRTWCFFGFFDLCVCFLLGFGGNFQCLWNYTESLKTPGPSHVFRSCRVFFTQKKTDETFNKSHR